MPVLILRLKTKGRSILIVFDSDKTEGHLNFCEIRQLDSREYVIKRRSHFSAEVKKLEDPFIVLYLNSRRQRYFASLKYQRWRKCTAFLKGLYTRLLLKQVSMVSS
jgi:hypothetical protein